MTFSSRLLAFFALLGMVDSPAFAEWVPIDKKYQSPGLRTIYIDAASIRRRDNLATISALIDWKSMQGGRSPTRFYSTIIRKEFDCTSNRVRSLAATDFYGHMGSNVPIGGGGSIAESHWMDVEPDSLNQGLWEAACGKD